MIDGGLGNDTLEAIEVAGGADVFLGGCGHDTISYGPRLAGVSVTLDEVANDGTTGDGDDVRDVETIIGGKGRDVLDGGEASVKNTIRGGPGDDDLFGEARTDTLNALDGVGGNDTLNGGTEFDMCKPDAGDTTVDCEA